MGWDFKKVEGIGFFYNEYWKELIKRGLKYGYEICTNKCK